jgi:hypothetical protein
MDLNNAPPPQICPTWAEMASRCAAGGRLGTGAGFFGSDTPDQLHTGSDLTRATSQGQTSVGQTTVGAGFGWGWLQLGQASVGAGFGGGKLQWGKLQR